VVIRRAVIQRVVIHRIVVGHVAADHIAEDRTVVIALTAAEVGDEERAKTSALTSTRQNL
jgi:hypothetical protein